MTENKDMADGTHSPEEALGLGPPQKPADPHSREAVLGGLGMATPESEGLLGTTPESETARTFDNMFRALPEKAKADFTESITTIQNKESSEDALVGALKKAPIPPGPEGDIVIQQMLEEGGHADKIDAILARRAEWEKSEQELMEDPEIEKEEDKQTLPKAKEDAKEILDETKSDMAIAKAINAKDIISPDEMKTLKGIEEKHRNRIQAWFDENPGKMHRANRLLIRPGIALALLAMIMYLSALNVITSGAARKVAK